MLTTTENMDRLIRNCTAAVREAREGSHLFRGWELLQVRDEDGNSRGMRPYTNEAITEFEKAYASDPGNAQVAHHLAIARHARAWDWELAGDVRARREWETALGYWRKVGSSPAFWADQKMRLSQCDPEVDPTFLDDARRDLLENLLDIHVAFVRQYSESGTADRARAHVEIVKRAHLPLAVKKRLVDKVFEAMTGSVADAKAQGAYTSALDCVDGFLELFSRHLPALRMHAEICTNWIDGMSYQSQWDDIVAAVERAAKPADALAQHSELRDDATAKSSLSELCFTVAKQAFDRTQSMLASEKEGRAPSPARRDAGQAACQMSIAWCRRGVEFSPAGSALRRLFPPALHALAVTYHREIAEVGDSDVDLAVRLDTAVGLSEREVALLEEAAALDPEKPILAEHLEIARKQRDSLTQQRDFDLLRRLEGTK